MGTTRKRGTQSALNKWINMSAAAVSLLHVVSAAEIVRGVTDYGACIESATCRGDGFYCFKRAGQAYAQCRPRETTPCIEAGLWDPTRHSANDWLCPGWEYCAATHGNCAYAKCCQNALDACLSRVRLDAPPSKRPTRHDSLRLPSCTQPFPMLSSAPCCPDALARVKHANYASCLPTYTSTILESLPAGTENRVTAAEGAACKDLKEMGWDCQRLIPETDACSNDCKRRARPISAASARPQRGLSTASARPISKRGRATRRAGATRGTCHTRHVPRGTLRHSALLDRLRSSSAPRMALARS